MIVDKSLEKLALAHAEMMSCDSRTLVSSKNDYIAGFQKAQEIDAARIAELTWEYENVCKFATDYEQRRDALKAKLAVAVEALGFYAKMRTNNYEAGGDGTTARNALATLEGTGTKENG